MRDPSITTVQTFQGSLPVRLTPVTPARNATIVVLADTLTVEDAARLRREIAAMFSTTFLSGHHLQLVSVTGKGRDFSTPLTTAAQVQAALKQIGPGNAPPDPATLIEMLGGVADKSFERLGTDDYRRPPAGLCQR